MRTLLDLLHKCERISLPAHSFATGPAIADPFISPLGFTEMGKASIRRFKESAQYYRVLTYDTGIVLEINSIAIFSPKLFALTNDYNRVNL